MNRSDSRIEKELYKLKKIFLENRNLEGIAIKFKKKVTSFPAKTKFCPLKFSQVYLPRIGNISLLIERQIKQAIMKCFFAFNPRFMYSTKKALPCIQNDCAPTTSLTRKFDSLKN